MCGGKTNNDHTENEYIWREAYIESMTTFLRPTRLRWYGHTDKDGREDITKEMLTMQVWEKKRKEGGQEKMDGQRQGGNERKQDDRRNCRKSKFVKKGRPIATRMSEAYG